ncbi:hypothetical protein PIROE2DRAFT_68145 [Piromyces sp. E2]|nr:hypothetical protein PIROE2DRAFT_68145 [Piromyces sp. E2]|eukprot:OUM64667.1 hypothetical protein PIROE2DRAFT_68145 [Piromyces sp. E2]
MTTVHKISSLQKNIKNIRNICILAHVDHGKTTLSDSLLASNGIISERLAGKVRYLDSREDEQERGITMESSGISLSFQVITNVLNTELKKEDYLINLIDSPGHIDFSSEVSIASRMCDGALVLVDVVEGICTQTHTVLRQAWDENIRCIIVFNKIDRLITELKLTATEAYIHIRNILEQINAIMGSFYAGGIMEEDNLKRENKNNDSNDINEENEWDEEKEKEIFFSPEKGNVIFASAIDGWAFRIDSFAKIYAKKLGIKETLLKKCLWGDYYLDPKAKKVIGYKHLKGRNLKPMFVQFILDNIWTIFEAVEYNDKEKVDKIVKSLNLKILPRDLKSKDTRAVQSTICSTWLPLAQTVLHSIVEQLPSPLEAQKVRLPKLLYPHNIDNVPDQDLTENQKKLEKALYECDSSEDAPVVVIVSKMVDVKPEDLPTNRRVQLTAEEMRENRKRLLEQRKLQIEGQTSSPSIEAVPMSEKKKKKENTLIGFARIFSGTIHEGQNVYVMGPKYDPLDPTKFCTKVKVENLYLIMGKELEALSSVPAGNVFGIGGLNEAVLKSATISTLSECPSLVNVNMKAPPIVRVAVEPYDPSDMPKLVEGLKLLNQADSCVEVLIQETGEHVIVTAGELHLERCLKDLRERYAKIGLHASDPIVPYRETLSNQPAINTNPFQEYSDDEESGEESNENDQVEKIKPKKNNLPIGTRIVNTSKNMCTIRIRAVPLPEKVTKFLVEQSETIKRIVEHYDNRRKNNASSEIALDEQKQVKDKNERKKFLDELQKLFDESSENSANIIDGNKQFWKDIVSRIWSFGSKRIGPNILINNIPGYERIPWCSTDGEKIEKDTQNKVSVKDFEGSINSGFQIATNSGPLCAEPMMGVCYILEGFDVNVDPENTDALSMSTLSGQVISTIKEGCIRAFLEWSPRLSLATYSCEIQATAEVLGKIYGVLSKRHARIYEEDLKEGTQFFQIKSLLPVIESFGFADEIRKRTSGAASPQLLFHG